MKYIRHLTICVFLLTNFSSCKESDIIGPTKIRWDMWGVPHIEAINDRELFFAFGWAQMHLHGDLLLQLYGKSRGQAAEYWGEEHLQSDIMIQTIGFTKMAEEWYQKLEPEFRSYLNAFTEGLNAYAEANPDSFKDEMRLVLPIQQTDVMKHYVYVIYGQFVAGGNIYQSGNWSQQGSNTYAIGPKRSASGNAMLVQNPHLPWSGSLTWIEAHLKSPETHMYGATLVGLPVLGITFNENLGWSHTNNTIDPSDLYELTLHDDGYMLDHEVKQFEKRKLILKVKNSGVMQEKEIDALESIFGPVIATREDKALALKFYKDKGHGGLQQWWEMGKSQNFNEFETAIKKHQIPFFNIMYADKEGNIFYMFNGFVPRRPEGDFRFWKGTVQGDTSRYFWDDILSYKELPKIKNPESGWLQNANDPPWTCTVPVELDHNEYPPYVAPLYMGFRPQRSARMLYEDHSITFDELVEYKLSTRVELADRLLDDLFQAIDEYGSDLTIQAGSILEKWDRSTNADSKGAILFMEWINKYRYPGDGATIKAWDLNDPINTPDGISNPEEAVRVLNEVSRELLDKYSQLDTPWGEIYKLRRGKIELPSNGGPGGPGIFRVVYYNAEDGKQYANSGDSWVGIIEFGDEVKAKVLLSYGNSSNPLSDHYGNQLELFSKKEFRDAWFYPKDLEGNIIKEEVLNIPNGL